MSERRISVTERAAIPAMSLLLGYGPVLLIVVGTVASWAVDGSRRAFFAHLTIIWAATILAFLAGVRRGLSFRTRGGPAPAQIATMMVFFTLALLALVALAIDLPRVAAALLLVGYGLPAVVAYDIPVGCIGTYYPEANVLLPLWHYAEGSKTPAAKAIPVTVHREGEEIVYPALAAE